MSEPTPPAVPGPTQEQLALDLAHLHRLFAAGIDRGPGFSHPHDCNLICALASRAAHAEAALAAERDKAAKLQKFKDWVHTYLDGQGVPHHPPGTHGAAGCRIGDRMDWLMAQLAAEREARQRIEFAHSGCPEVIAAWRDAWDKTNEQRDAAQTALAAERVELKAARELLDKCCDAPLKLELCKQTLAAERERVAELAAQVEELAAQLGVAEMDNRRLAAQLEERRQDGGTRSDNAKNFPAGPRT